MGIVARTRSKTLVRNLYRSILGREPDPDGARFYESLIGKLGPDRAVPKILKSFVRSKEYRDRADAVALSYVNAGLAAQGNQMINGRPVAHLVPLGSFCLPAIILRNNGLRRYSLPFDWIFSAPQMVRDCLADDFEVFLDQRHYRSISDQRRDPCAEH